MQAVIMQLTNYCCSEGGTEDYKVTCETRGGTLHHHRGEHHAHRVTVSNTLPPLSVMSRSHASRASVFPSTQSSHQAKNSQIDAEIVYEHA